jgi:NAD(P)-dependent dehydrogenase (short-subunit alcohol dehydrogenase family)
MMSQRFLPLLRASPGARVVNVTSELGSLSAKTTDSVQRNYWYDTSKAALNMVTRLLAADLSSEGIVVSALAPGWVQTDMGGTGASVGAEQAVAHIISTIDRIRPDHSGAYLARDGQELPW